MTNHRLETCFWVPASIDEVWGFFMDPHNLARLTPASKRATVEVLEAGQQVRIRLAPLPLVPFDVEWIARLETLESSGSRRSFVDTQERGPFAYWRHEHLFEEGDASFEGSRSSASLSPARKGTWITDHVEYALPFGELGRLGGKSLVRRELEALFAFRREKAREIFV